MSKAQRIRDLEKEIAQNEAGLAQLREQLAELTWVNPDPLCQFLEKLEEETREWYCGPDHSVRFDEHFGRLIIEFLEQDRSRIADRLNATMKDEDQWSYIAPETRGALMAMIQAGGK